MVTLKDSGDLTPNFTLPNARLVFDKDISAMPVPESADCCGLVVALSKIITVALSGPTASGVNDTPSVQLVLGATVIGNAPQVPLPLSANSGGSDNVALEIVSELVFPVLVTVRFFVTV